MSGELLEFLKNSQSYLTWKNAFKVKSVKWLDFFASECISRTAFWKYSIIYEILCPFMSILHPTSKCAINFYVFPSDCRTYSFSRKRGVRQPVSDSLLTFSLYT